MHDNLYAVLAGPKERRVACRNSDAARTRMRIGCCRADEVSIEQDRRGVIGEETKGDGRRCKSGIEAEAILVNVVTGGKADVPAGRAS